MVLEQITEAGKQIKGFAELPITAQVSVLYMEIEAARKLSIPLSAICDAMNLAGSTVTLRYLREALSVVRRRMKDQGIAPGSGPAPRAQSKPSTQQSVSSSTKPATMPVQSGKAETPHKTPKEARDEKADSYTSSASNNPLLRQLQKPKD